MKKTTKYDFEGFIRELRQDPEEGKVITEYEAHYGPIAVEDITRQKWYEDYLAFFQPVSFEVPEELGEAYDWELLQRLLAGSFSAIGDFEIKNGKVDLVVFVETNEQRISKSISSLWSFQVERLFEIWIKEQMNLQVLVASDQKERDAILPVRNKRLEAWNNSLISYSALKEISAIVGVGMNDMERLSTSF